MVEHYDYLIIGSGVAGYFALKELLRIRPEASIAMVTSDRYYPYDRPPLSKEYIRGEVSRDDLFFEDASFYERSNLRVFLGKSVDRIETREKLAVLSDGSTIGFGRALIATGGRPRTLSNIGGEGVYYLRTLDDADSIREAAKSGGNPLIIGGGFIGIEVAASLRKLGLNPTVVELKPYIWNVFVDEKVAGLIQRYLESRGVRIITNDSVREWSRSGRVAVTEGGSRVNADFVLVAVGITPNVELAQRSGIEVSNGIVVDEYLQTSAPDIYAAGDVANIYDPREGRRKRIEHWNNAQYTGVLAARNMAGMREAYDFLSTIWSDIFDLHIESAGETMNYDEYLVRGRFSEDNPSFAIVYLRGGLVRGYFAINREEGEIEALNELVRRGVDVSNRRSQVVDESFDLRQLVGG